MPTDQQNYEEIAEFIHRGDLEGAENMLKACAESAHTSSQWWMMMGQLLLKQGQLSEACAKLEKAIEIDGDNTEAIFQLAYAVDLHGEDERAIELYERCVSEPPMHVHALINLAVLYEDRGAYDQAEICLEQVLDHYPNHTRAALFLKDVQSSKNMFYDEDQERDREKQSAILDIPISDFELSVRSRNCLKKMNIHTLGDLLRTTEPELLSYKNFGETSLNEIKVMLKQKGLRLGHLIEEEEKARRDAPGTVVEVPPAVDAAVLSKPVSELELSVRSRKCLQRLGISTLGDLASKTEAELLGSKNFGQTSLAEIHLRLAESGLSLRRLDSKTKRSF